MKKGYKDHTPSVSLAALGTLCFMKQNSRHNFHTIVMRTYSGTLRYEFNLFWDHHRMSRKWYLKAAGGKLSERFAIYGSPMQLWHIPNSYLKFYDEVTLIMSQTRFKITKEMNHEMYPPALRNKDCWFLYSIGNPDRFKCILRAFVVMSSPVLSLISTGLLLFGKVESNPYFFIPWLFLTLKGLLLVQTDNIITVLRDMSSRTTYAFGFRAEDFKWIIFYFTIFLIDLVETVSFYEIFDLFLVLWNHHPGYNVEPISLEVIKKEIADIMETLSKCSIGNLSSISLGSVSSDDTNEVDAKDTRSNAKEEDKISDTKRSFKNVPSGKQPFEEPYAEGMFDDDYKKQTAVKGSLEPFSKGDSLGFDSFEDQKGMKVKEKDLFSGDLFDAKTPIKS